VAKLCGTQSIGQSGKAIDAPKCHELMRRAPIGAQEINEVKRDSPSARVTTIAFQRSYPRLTLRLFLRSAQPSFQQRMR